MSLADPRDLADLLATLYETEWVVYANPPFGRHEVSCREALGVTAAEPPPALATDWTKLLARLTGTDPTRCPKCGRSALVAVAEIPAAGRGPPRLRRVP